MLHHREQHQRLQEKLRRELGLNVLTALRDPDITEVMLNPDGSLWSESQRDGQLDTGARMSEIQAENLIGTVASMLGTVVNTGLPIVEGELPLDGNRFEGILPPVSTAPVFVIRKRAGLVYTLDDYVTAGIVEPWQAEALRDAIRTRQNIVIAGGTASGKTTLANALIHEMVALGDPTVRFVILEDTRELQCTARNAIQLRTGDVADLTRLARVTMRLRPDRIVIGEVRGAEALALFVGDAGSAAIGPPMPWDGPLLMILASLSGTVAHVLITVAVIVTGLVFAFTEHGSGARRLFGVAFGGALALGALSFMTAVGWAGATF